MDTTAGEDAPWTSVNHTVLNTFGQEITLRISPASMLRINSFPVREINLGYSHISQNKVLDENLRSLYSMEYVRHKFTASSDIHIWRRLSANLSARYIDRATESQLIKPYWLLDARLGYDAPHYNIYVRLNNLLNRTYYDFGDIPQPGFWLVAGLTCKLW